jgi:hypothetical protein
LTELLSRFDGKGIWVYEMQLMTVDDIRDAAGNTGACIPFAKDVDGNMMVVNTESGEAVFEYDDDGLGSEICPSFTAYIEKYRNDLLSGKFEYIEDCGVVEKMGGSAAQETKSNRK